jgi:hypothetical protein
MRGILGDLALCGRDRDFGAETAVYAAPRLPDREAEQLMSFRRLGALPPLPIRCCGFVVTDKYKLILYLETQNMRSKPQSRHCYRSLSIYRCSR